MNDFLMVWFVVSVVGLGSLLLFKLFDFIEMCNRTALGLKGYSLYLISSDIKALDHRLNEIEKRNNIGIGIK